MILMITLTMDSDEFLNALPYRDRDIVLNTSQAYLSADI